MVQLISKIQYQNFEAGEFVEIKERSYEETISIIEAFPWTEERNNLKVDLTNPSITIVNSYNEFLKIALYYNGKFVLHYYNNSEELFTKSISAIEACYYYINEFYKDSTFDISDFKKEKTWFKENIKHFKTKSFEYEMTADRFYVELFNKLGILFIILMPLIFILLFHFQNTATWYTMTMLFLVPIVISLCFFIHFYRLSKNKILIMSKGNDIFYFGNLDTPNEYNKKDILQINRFKTGRKPLLEMIKIQFNSGETIAVTNLFLDIDDLMNKLNNCTVVYHGLIKFYK